MDFMDMLNFAVNTELTNVDFNLPDELVESVRDGFIGYAQAIYNVAAYLYGDNPTQEQVMEAGVVAIMSFRKEHGI